MADRAKTWLTRAASLPEGPGVYLMKDRAGTIVYVGKAKDLKSRVSSYFQEGSSDYRAFVSLLSGLLGDIETVVAGTEKEALIMERELIRQHEPRFNIIWRDDKQYLCLRVDPTHEYPWVEVVRNMKEDGARYFGPFHSATAARQTLRVVNRHFQLRTCRDSVLYNRDRPCLEYQIGRCPAPCVFEIDRAKYHANVDDVIMFLEGKGQSLVEDLQKRMWEASEKTEYETAARIRDQIRAVTRTLEPQHVALPSLRDQDVIGLHREGEEISVALVSIRKGRVKSVDAHFFDEIAVSDGDALESFLLQYYAKKEDMPAEVVVPIPLSGAQILSELLSEKRKRKVRIVRPQRGERVRVLDLANKNAEHALYERRRKSGGTLRLMENLKKRLGLLRRPDTIECVDISNLGSGAIVGSKVCFVRGLPDKDQYRRYRVRTTEGQDDFASMFEVLKRRLSRGQSEGALPDLLVIDGGKGQLGVAKAVMKELGIENLDVVGLAKSRVVGREEKTERAVRSKERVFVLGAKDPIVLPQSSPELLLLARIRDEAHRFAITFHRSVRQREGLSSVLEEIPGIGEKRRRALLRHLGSVKRIEAASVDELAQVPGMSRALAERVHGFFAQREA